MGLDMGKVDDDISDLESKRDFDGLVKHLSSKSGRARGLAANALGKRGDSSYLPHLEKMLLQEDNSKSTIECAKWAIGDLTRKQITQKKPTTTVSRSRSLADVAKILLIVLTVTSFLGALILGYDFWESGLGTYFVVAGIVYSILLLALVAILDELTKIRVSSRQQEKLNLAMTESLETINESLIILTRLASRLMKK